MWPYYGISTSSLSSYYHSRRHSFFHNKTYMTDPSEILKHYDSWHRLKFPINLGDSWPTYSQTCFLLFKYEAFILQPLLPFNPFYLGKQELDHTIWKRHKKCKSKQHYQISKFCVIGPIFTLLLLFFSNEFPRIIPIWTIPTDLL
jgi:hypothetical protein